MAEEERKPVADSSGRASRWPWILALVISSAIAAWLCFRQRGESPAQASDTSPVRSTLHLETFVLNVDGSGLGAYLRIGIDLGLNQDAKRAEQAVPVAKIRDVILDVLGQANADDLLTLPGKTKLKHDLLRGLQGHVPALGAEQIYFTEFLVQR